LVIFIRFTLCDVRNATAGQSELRCNQKPPQVLLPTLERDIAERHQNKNGTMPRQS
jgi:hypothetical protein